MKMLFAGGSKSGKSMAAQKAAQDLAGGSRSLYYVATMIPSDDEDRARIAAHIEARKGWGFETIEQGRNIGDLLTDSGAGRDGGPPIGRDGVLPIDRDGVPPIDKDGVFLIDSVTALLGNEMFPSSGDVDHEAARRIAAELADFAGQVRDVIFVSDWIFADAAPQWGMYDELTEEYRRGLAEINRSLASLCDRVFEYSAGMKTEWK